MFLTFLFLLTVFLFIRGAASVDNVFATTNFRSLS
jgi:hypothetical protein